ncbi:hypothetical protein ACEPAF_6324 [Sanghuangporus sanghuang]
MYGKEKENTPLQQSTLNFTKAPSATGVKDVATSKGKKRTVAVSDDFAINLNNAGIPVTKEVVEAMRKRILELEEQLEGQSAVKRPKLSNPAEEPPKAGPSTSTSGKSGRFNTDPKKIDAIIKKIWSSLQKEVKTEKYKFRGGPPKTCRIEEVIEEDEFFEIFTGRPDYAGVIQPRPDNKPGSSVHIYEYPTEEIEKIFGKHHKELKGNRYSLGGIAARFAKGQKIGLVLLNINHLQVNYSRNIMKCGMKFEVEETYPYRCSLDDFGDLNEVYISDLMLGFK